ncbi:MarR family transcriptional regulator [Glutamicibacter halophytocola]|uniref:MarR family winged helix-turn-helix transcriptional regulator n=1 Tax=Glutamicibacter halophytocola TaxID=1933880 RepID=UPI003219E500
MTSLQLTSAGLCSRLLISQGYSLHRALATIDWRLGRGTIKAPVLPRFQGVCSNVDSAILPEDDLLKLEKQVCFGLAVASRTVISAYKPVLDPLGLTHPQYLVMLALWDSGPMSARELSEQLHLDPGTLSPLVKRLEAAGLVDKSKNPQDERAVILQPTDKGAELRKEALKVPAADDVSTRALREGRC